MSLKVHKVNTDYSATGTHQFTTAVYSGAAISSTDYTVSD